MSRYHLATAGQWSAFMAGMHAADVQQYMVRARREKSRSARCIWVRAARDANRKMCQYIKRARGGA